MWAHVWAETVTAGSRRHRHDFARAARRSRASSPRSCSACAAPVPPNGDARDVLDAVAWIAPGFEIVQSHFPGLEVHAGRLHRRVRPAPRAGRRPAYRAHRRRRATRCAASLPCVRAHAAPRRGRDRSRHRRQRPRQPGARARASGARARRATAMPPLARRRAGDHRHRHRCVAGGARRHLVERLRDARPAGPDRALDASNSPAKRLQSRLFCAKESRRCTVISHLPQPLCPVARRMRQHLRTRLDRPEADGGEGIPRRQPHPRRIPSSRRRPLPPTRPPCARARRPARTRRSARASRATPRCSRGDTRGSACDCDPSARRPTAPRS